MSDDTPTANPTPGATTAPPLPHQPNRPQREPLGRVLLRALACLLLGVAVAAIGTTAHRTLWHGFPVGILIAFALVASLALFARALGGMTSLVAAAIGWIATIELLSLATGSSVLITAPEAHIPLPWLGVAWSYGGVALYVLAAFAPRRWFARAAPPQ